MNGLRKFFIRLLLFLAAVVFIDFLLGQLFSFLLEKQNDGRYYKIQYSLKHANEDIIIIGSSRAETNYNPAVFSEVLGLSCWNTGRGGLGILYFLAIEQEILNRIRPKLIIINLDPNALEGTLEYDNYSILRPFAKEYPEIFNLLSRKDFSEKYKLRSNIYAYNSVLFYFMRSFFVKNKDGNFADKGWKPKSGEISGALISNARISDTSSNNLDKEKVEVFNEMIDLAMNKKCKLIFLISPDYFVLENETSTINYVKKVAEKCSFPVFDFTQDTSLIEKQKYFYDLEHLNSIGATQFSEIVANQIVKMQFDIINLGLTLNNNQ